MSVDLTYYRIDTTNGHVDRIPRLPALVQSFLGTFFFVCFVAVLGIVHEAAVLPQFCLLFLLFTSSFCMTTPNQTFEGYMYQFNSRKRGLPFVRVPKTCTYRHRNYRLISSLVSRYRPKRKNRLPPKNDRRMVLLLNNYRQFFVLPPPPKSLPPKNE